MKHGFLHLLGCLIPIALVFLLPALGFSSSSTFTIFVLLMFACHLLMVSGHPQGGHETNGSENSDETNNPSKGGKSCH